MFFLGRPKTLLSLFSVMVSALRGGSDTSWLFLLKSGFVIEDGAPSDVAVPLDPSNAIECLSFSSCSSEARDIYSVSRIITSYK